MSPSTTQDAALQHLIPCIVLLVNARRRLVTLLRLSRSGAIDLSAFDQAVPASADTLLSVMTGLGRTLLVLFASLSAAACSTAAPKPQFGQVIQPSQALSKGTVIIGKFSDERTDYGFGEYYLGTTRNGFGGPMERMVFMSPVSDVAAETIARALQHCGYTTLLVSDARDDRRSAGPVLVGRIKKLSGENTPRPFATLRHVDLLIELELVSPINGARIWEGRLTGYQEDYKKIQFSRNIEIFGPWVTRLIEDSAVRELCSVDFAGLWKSEASRNSPPTPPESESSQDLEARLRVLKRSYEQGLITKDEYDAKRRAIVSNY